MVKKSRRFKFDEVRQRFRLTSTERRVAVFVAAAFVLYSMAFGVVASRRALLVDPSTLLGTGLLVALGSGVPAVLLGRPFMTASWMTVRVGPAAVDVGTPLVFDIGVFLAVIGVVLTIVFTLSDVARAED